MSDINPYNLGDPTKNSNSSVPDEPSELREEVEELVTEYERIYSCHWDNSVKKEFTDKILALIASLQAENKKLKNRITRCCPMCEVKIEEWYKDYVGKKEEIDRLKREVEVLREKLKEKK